MRSNATLFAIFAGVFVFLALRQPQAVDHTARDYFLCAGALTILLSVSSSWYWKYGRRGHLISIMKSVGLREGPSEYAGRYKGLSVRIKNVQTEPAGMFGFVHHLTADLENPAGRAVSWPEIYKALPFPLEQELDRLIEPWQRGGASFHLTAHASYIRMSFRLHFGPADLFGAGDLAQLQRILDLFIQIQIKLRGMLTHTVSPRTPDVVWPTPTYF